MRSSPSCPHRCRAPLAHPRREFDRTRCRRGSRRVPSPPGHPHNAERNGFRKETHLGFALGTPVPLRQEDTGVSADFSLQQGDTASFVLQGVADDEGCSTCFSDPDLDRAFKETVHYWEHWVAGSRCCGRCREMVNRSALALRLLT